MHVLAMLALATESDSCLYAGRPAQKPGTSVLPNYCAADFSHCPECPVQIGPQVFNPGNWGKKDGRQKERPHPVGDRPGKVIEF